MRFKYITPKKTVGRIYYDFVQGLNFIDPNGFNTTIFWDEITIQIKETNLSLTF